MASEEASRYTREQSFGSGESYGDTDAALRTTKAMPGSSSERGRYQGQGATRKIVGILVTYSWKAEGQLFPVREGKNFIGRDQVCSEVPPRPCDVQIPQDMRMSGEHALILCRAGNFEIIDETSSNGTFLDNEFLKAGQSYDLRNYAEIITGSTTWMFVRALPPQDANLTPEPKHEPPPSEEEGVKR